MAVTDDAWASLLPDLLLEILCRLETTAVVRCAAACKPWRRIIISNASSLRPCPDRYNPNLLLGFINRSWYQGITKDGSLPPPPAATSVITIDSDTDVTGCCEKLSSFITPTFSGFIGIVISLCYSTLTSRDGFLLLRRHRSIHDRRLCLYNPMAGDCKFLPTAPIMEMEAHVEGEYVLLTGYDRSPSQTSRDDMAVRILAMPRWLTYGVLLTYQVFCCSDDGAAVWGPVQRSQVNKDLLVRRYGGNTVVSRDAVHWFGRTRDIMGCRITCTVGLDVYTGRAWTTELPKQCQFYCSSTTPCALITSGNGRVSLLQPLLNHNIQVWVLDGEISTMEWTMQHKIWIDEQIHRDIVVHPASLLGCNYPKVICPRSGLLFIMSFDKRLQLCIDVESGACQPVQTIGHSQYHRFDPYEMDWSTYISKMKIF